MLPAALRPHAAGIRPLAVVVLSRECLDALLRPEFDAVFAADLFCELRLATVVQAAGFRIGEMPGLDEVGHRPLRAPARLPGIWHPVKSGPD